MLSIMFPLIIDIFQGEFIKPIPHEKSYYACHPKNKAVRIDRKEEAVERVNHTDSS
jgi:hypothetical protein